MIREPVFYVGVESSLLIDVLVDYVIFESYIQA